MKWFRRRDKEAAPVRPAAPARAAHPAGTGSHARVTPVRGSDWRSYDFADAAGGYARAIAPMTAGPAADLFALAGVEPGTALLDVGCGTGSNIATLARAVGVDASSAILVEGRRASSDAPLVAADVIDLPFADGSFEVVSAVFVLGSVTKLDTALFDMIRVLRPGGRVAVAVWTEVMDDLTRTWRSLAEEVLGPELLRDAIAQGTPWAEHLMDAHRLEGALRDAGLRPVRVEKRRYRNELTRDDYVTGRSSEVVGRYVRAMLGPKAWGAFDARGRARFAESFSELVVDFRDVLLAVGTKPA